MHLKEIVLEGSSLSANSARSTEGTQGVRRRRKKKKSRQWGCIWGKEERVKKEITRRDRANEKDGRKR